MDDNNLNFSTPFPLFNSIELFFQSVILKNSLVFICIRHRADNTKNKVLRVLICMNDPYKINLSVWCVKEASLNNSEVSVRVGAKVVAQGGSIIFTSLALWLRRHKL